MKLTVLFSLIIMLAACGDDGLAPTGEGGGSVVPPRSNINSPNLNAMIGLGVSGAGSFRSERYKGFGALGFMQRGKGR